jgi:hypothetical protein
MWGRWSLRCDFNSDLVTCDPVELWSVLNDSTYDIGNVRLLARGDECRGRRNLYMVSYRRKKDFIRPHSKYNVVLSLFTTSAARCHLYKYMEMVGNDALCKILYSGEFQVFHFSSESTCLRH